jgi:hypothetical protein
VDRNDNPRTHAKWSFAVEGWVFPRYEPDPAKIPQSGIGHPPFS